MRKGKGRGKKKRGRQRREERGRENKERNSSVVDNLLFFLWLARLLIAMGFDDLGKDREVKLKMRLESLSCMGMTRKYIF